MKISLITFIASLSLVACATNGVSAGTSPALAKAHLQVGKFVEFTCEGGRFSARLADDQSTIRIRSINGSSELDRQANETWSADGFVLTLEGADGIVLSQNNKTIGKNCKPQI